MSTDITFQQAIAQFPHAIEKAHFDFLDEDENQPTLEEHLKMEEDGYDYQVRDGVLYAHPTGGPSDAWSFWNVEKEVWMDEDFGG